MSARNGDKSKFGRERKQKIRRRKLTREARVALERKQPTPVEPARDEDAPKSGR